MVLFLDTGIQTLAIQFQNEWLILYSVYFKFWRPWQMDIFQSPYIKHKLFTPTHTHHPGCVGGVVFVPVCVSVNAQSSAGELNECSAGVFLLAANLSLSRSGIETNMVLTVDGLQLSHGCLASLQPLCGYE